MGGAYYNEIDPYAAEWLRNLIAARLIPDGEVDERDIQDVLPSELEGFTQCHFFAGIGGWSQALRLAKWSDDRPVWTGSCPCQPFSQAGKKRGKADERHLWPAFFHLIKERKPSVVFGEQVASPDGIAWLDLVSSDLEGEGYACGPIVLPACGVGAPHLRQRIWFLALPDGERLDRVNPLLQSREPRSNCAEASRSREACAMADPESFGRRKIGKDSGRRSQGNETPQSGLGLEFHGHAGELGNAGLDRIGDHAGKLSCDESQYEERTAQSDNAPIASSPACIVDDANSAGLEGRPGQRKDHGKGIAPPKRASGPTNGFWEDAEWLYCRDGKYRPVKPGTFPLAHGIPARVGQLRAAGNAIVPEVAAEVIGAYMEWCGE